MYPKAAVIVVEPRVVPIAIWPVIVKVGIVDIVAESAVELHHCSQSAICGGVCLCCVKVS